MTSTDHPGTAGILRRLAEICGPGFARLAGPADEVAGAAAGWVAVPGNERAAAELLRLAEREGLTVVPRGAGTKLDWGLPPRRLDLILDTGRLAGIGHRAGAPTIEVGAGTPLRAVQAALERRNLRLALDAPSPGATVGGVLAANEAGPLRLRHGSPGDQLVEVRYLDAAGRLVILDATGAGLERAQLLCGSQGGLGLLVSATLRVQPQPASQVWVGRPVWSPLQADDLIRAVLDGPISPAAIELDLPGLRAVPDGLAAARARHPSAANHPAGSARRGGPTAPPAVGELVVLLEGGPSEVAERTARLVEIFGPRATVARSAPQWWLRYPFRPADVALRIEAPPEHLHAAVYALRDAVGESVPVRGAVGVGTLHAGLPGAWPPERIRSIVTALRDVLTAREGRCVVLAAPPAVRAAVDVWGELPVLPRLRAAKENVDPHQRLAPGRLPGGI